MKIVKLIKQMYYNKKGIEKVNCYHINLNKSIIENAGLQDCEYVSIKAENGKIIIEKA